MICNYVFHHISNFVSRFDISDFKCLWLLKFNLNTLAWTTLRVAKFFTQNFD